MENNFKELAELLLNIYVGSFLAVPLISGYILYRYVHIIIRFIIVLWIISSGYIFCKYSYHGFLEAYIPGNILFIGTGVIGQAIKAKSKKTEFWKENHTDLILLAAFNLVYWIVYVRPSV